MSAPQIPNLLTSRGGPRLRGGRGRGRGRPSPDLPLSSTPTQHRKDLDIQSTDSDASVSRLSAVSLGYLHDPFALLFVTGPGTRRLPIINRGTYTRTTALDILINAFLSPNNSNNITAQNRTAPRTQTKQVISLGAGTDTRYFRLRTQNKHKNLIYHEFDFPSVCEAKARIVSNNTILREADASFFVKNTYMGETEQGAASEWGFSRETDGIEQIEYCCHPLDLRHLPYFPETKSLENFHGIRSDVPTLLISECCLCYLETNNARDVAKWFVDRIPSLGIILYEPIGVDDSFGQMMVANLAARNITMPTVKVYKTLQDQKDRLSQMGFEGEQGRGGREAETVERIWDTWVPDEEKERVDRLEGLDEVEEWQMLARHYSVVWGWKGSSGDEDGWWGWESWKDNWRALIEQRHPAN